ncbi:uncharacterized protein LOC105181074 [Harpegnathos saltator]|uniref:uncharacterized protein LOC105181074 n=1 Tax=Harpegnathos saltator TaxID=610380 RepID=UPI000DBED9F5|nr:uncharacterized protein LOC105181074 [Harpegnathos saltator]
MRKSGRRDAKSGASRTRRREPVSTCGDCDTRKMQFRWMRPLHRRIRFGPSRVGSKNRKRNAADPEFPLIE